MLVDRARELQELNSLLQVPAARLVTVSGRRRLGKCFFVDDGDENCRPHPAQ